MGKKIWGAKSIGAEINRDYQQTFYLLERGLIRCAKKVGRQWVADEDELQREFGAELPAKAVSA
jgi:hypothetical protein